MNEHLRNNYFTAVKTLLLVIILLYTILSCSLLTGASVRVPLLLALFTGSLTFKEVFKRGKQIWFLAAAALIFFVIFGICGKGTILLGILAGYEILTYIRPDIRWYFLPAAFSLINVGEDTVSNIVIALLLCIIYIQHDHVVSVYRDQTKENTLNEQSLKHDMDRRENEMKLELQKSLLSAENQVLEERAQLSQTLHDKLGHNINGSVYQLEAVKLLMEKDPERSKGMIQAVIDQLRSGMDEIRAILRNKRPAKHLLAAAQLEKLCEGCRSKGIDTEFTTDGELSAVPEKYLEIILDNCYEAVSNSLKYSGCTGIKIQIYVMNKFVRCTISDNGSGCANVTDGMGISGMRRRVREANGILEISSDMGFSVNMLLPL
ncbi:sensor histidine kinase [uncultured Ruminococcus sp.]|uniref:sensor histidine kinase n=1 Tax=uncultured Ruminococcus sp. TaxID=165186 RepID=UPI0025FE38A5|nr:histidine kinase [uncultured Ruminococcus sp.]